MPKIISDFEESEVDKMSKLRTKSLLKIRVDGIKKINKAIKFLQEQDKWRTNPYDPIMILTQFRFMLATERTELESKGKK